jgi:hypothetical protein
MIRSIRMFALLFLAVVASNQIHAQVPTGSPPFGSFGGGPDVIDLANLNTQIIIPLLHKTGRGTDFSYDLTYDSTVWFPIGTSGSQVWTPVSNFGWSAVTESATGYISANQSTDEQCGFWKQLGGGHQIFIVTGYVYDYTGWIYHDSLHVLHPFTGSTIVYTGSCTSLGSNTSFNATSTDGSGYKLQATGSGG